MEKSDKALRTGFDTRLGTLEVVIYTVLAILLSLTAFVSLGTAGKLLWDGLGHWTFRIDCDTGYLAEIKIGGKMQEITNGAIRNFGHRGFLRRKRTGSMHNCEQKRIVENFIFPSVSVI